MMTSDTERSTRKVLMGEFDGEDRPLKTIRCINCGELKKEAEPCKCGNGGRNE